MSTILVTGGAGFIGSHACKALAEAGFNPIAFDNLLRGHVTAAGGVMLSSASTWAPCRVRLNPGGWAPRREVETSVRRPAGDRRVTGWTPWNVHSFETTPAVAVFSRGSDDILVAAGSRFRSLTRNCTWHPI